MEIELSMIDRSASVWDVKRAIGSVLHSDDFFNPSDPKARPVNFKVTLNEGPAGIIHNGSGLLVVPTARIGDKLMNLIYGRKSTGIYLNDRKIGLRKTYNQPNYKLTQSLDKTPYLNPEIEEERESKLAKLDVALHVDKVQFGVFYRKPDDPPQVSRRFSNEYEISHRHKGAGLFTVEYEYKCIRIQLGDKTTDEIAYNITVTFANIRKIAVGLDFGNPFICFDLLTPPVYQKESFNRTLTGDDYVDNKKFRQRIDSINHAHNQISPYAHQIRVVLHRPEDLDKFSYLCYVAGLPRPFRAAVEADRQNFFTNKVLFRIKQLLLRYDWPIAFQLEALLRGGLVTSFDLLGPLLKPVEELCKREPATAADTLRLFTEELRSRDGRQSVLDCFLQVCSQEVGSVQPKLPSEGPYAIQSNRVIRKYPNNQNNFLRVDFRDEDRLQYRWTRDVDGASLLEERVGGILKNGIEVAGRHFHFLAYSNSALREHAVWFIHPFSTLDQPLVDGQTIRDSLGDFSHLSAQPSKYAARIAQAFTATDPSVSIGRDQWEEMEDLGQKPYEFTDGVGTISRALGDLIWEALCKDRDAYYRKQVKPSAYQIRFLGYKGMVAIDDQLEGIKMRLRRSMNKFEGPKDMMADIEIARSFERPGTSYLNRPLIMVLEDRGVDKKAFLKLQNNAVADIHMASDTIHDAAQLFVRHTLGSSYRLTYILRCLASIHMGMKRERPQHILENQFIDRLIHVAKYSVLRDIKHGARIPIPDSHHLVGVADEGPAYKAAGHEDVFMLGEGQIFCCVQKGPDEAPEYVQGAVIITRSPTVHPGDVQRVWAIGKPPDDKLCLFRNLKNAVVLPSVGARSLASMLGGGDLDGDLYSVIKESTLLPTEHVDAASYDSAGTRELDRASTIDDVCDFVVEYINSDLLGLLSDLHLIIADQSKYGTKDSKCETLSRLCSQAVDYPKNGIPVSMEQAPRRLIPYRPDWKQADTTVLHETDYYVSTRALGELFRNVNLPPTLSALGQPNGSAQRPFPLSDSISQALKPIIELHLGVYINQDRDVGEMSPIFQAYAQELKYICLTHSLTDSPDDRLTEEEVAVGVILANCTQDRYRKDRMYRMRLHSRTLSDVVRNKLYQRQEIPEMGGLRYGLSQAWLAWDFAMRNRNVFGANSFALIALGLMCNIFEELGDMSPQSSKLDEEEDSDDEGEGAQAERRYREER